MISGAVPADLVVQSQCASTRELSVPLHVQPGRGWRQVVEVVIGVHGTTLPLQLSPPKEPFVRRLCICGVLRHYKVAVAERKAVEKTQRGMEEKDQLEQCIIASRI